MKKYLLLLIPLLLVIQPVAAADFSISVEGAKEFLAGRSYTLDMKITNSGKEDWFSISAVGVPSAWITIDSSAVKVAQGQIATPKVSFLPGKDARPGVYNYDFSITRSSDGAVAKTQFAANILQVTSVIVTNLLVSCITCLDEITVGGTVENVGTRNVNTILKLSIGIDGKTLAYGEMQPFDTKEFSQSFDLAGVKPADYSLLVQVADASGKVIYEDTKLFTIPRIEEFDYDKKVSSIILADFVVLSAKNTGNVEADAQLKSIISKNPLVLYSGPDPTSLSGREAVWSVGLSPGEAAEIRYSELNLLYSFLLIAIIAGGIVWYLNYTALLVTKHANKHELRKGDEVSMSITVANRARDRDSVIVKDIVPSQFALTGKFGTLKPTIRKLNHGTELVWRVGKMGKHETRVLHYNVKVVADIVGDLHLPKSEVRGREGTLAISRHSNIVVLYGPQGENTIRVKVSR